MHLGKFHAAVDTLVREYSENQIPTLLGDVTNFLESIASNPGNPEVAAGFKASLTRLRHALGNSSLNKPYPTLATLLNSIGAQDYIGDRLFLRIEKVIEQNGMTPQLAAIDIRAFATIISNFYTQLSAIDTAFESLEVEYEELNAGEGEIGISIPEPTRARLLSDLAITAKNWNKALRPFVEIADPQNNPIEVKTISSTDWQFYLTAAPSVLLILSGALNQINDLLRKLVEMRGLITKLIENEVSDIATAAVAADADRMLQNGTRKIAEKIVHDNPPVDEQRGNELKNELTISLKFIAREMAENVTIEVRYLPPPATTNDPKDETEVAEVKLVGELTEAAAQIARNMDLIALDPETREILNLPAPADEEGDQGQA